MPAEIDGALEPHRQTRQDGGVDSRNERLLVPDADAGAAAERLQIASAIADQTCRRYPADVLAVGAHGSLAHNDGREGSDIDIVVVTYRSQSGPAPTSREIDGWIVDLGVISADEYTYHARILSTRWPLMADQYLNTRPLVDQVGWHQRLRDTHLARLADASTREFTTLAREAWCSAASLFRRAARCGEWFDTDGALLLLAEARTATAIVEGLLTRTYYRSSADAARRTGIGSLDLAELRKRLEDQAEQLTQRGRSVAGEVSDLFG